MARKKSTTPSRIYSYGCLPPADGEQLMLDELWKANQYRNQLVEIELARRARYHAIIATLLPEEMLDLVDELEANAEAATAALKRAKAGAGRRAPVDGESELLAAVKDDLKMARGFLRTAKEAVKAALSVAGGDANLTLLPKFMVERYGQLKTEAGARGGKRKPFLDFKKESKSATDRALTEIAAGEQHAAIPQTIAKVALALRQSEEMAHTALLAARADKTRCPHTGTYLLVEKAAETFRQGAPPRFKRFDGEGKIAVHLEHGRSVEEILSGEDTSLRVIQPTPALLAKRPRHHGSNVSSGAKAQSVRLELDIRAGSNEDRSPKWVVFPLILHRPLPVDARIKDAWVIRRRIGYQWRYNFQLALESSTFERPAQPAGAGTVYLNLGWRQLLENIIPYAPDAVRVCYWRNDRGEEGDLRLPSTVMPGLTKVDDLRSIRDQHLDFAKAWFLIWLRDHAAELARPVEGRDAVSTTSRPADDRAAGRAWLLARVQYLAQWRAQAKLAKLLDDWKAHRFEGDAGIFEALQAWAKKDRHLHSWEAHLRDRCINHRREVWRTWATEIARTYDRAVICEMDLRDFASAPEADEGVPSDGRDQRRIARRAAPGELRESIRLAAHKTAMTVEEVKAAGLTQRCHICGCQDPWDAKPSVMHTCIGCGARWDQDANHVRNLARQRERPGDDAVREGARAHEG